MISENNDSGHGKIFSLFTGTVESTVLGFHECKDLEKLCAVG